MIVYCANSSLSLSASGPPFSSGTGLFATPGALG